MNGEEKEISVLEKVCFQDNQKINGNNIINNNNENDNNRILELGIDSNNNINEENENNIDMHINNNN